MDKIDGRTPGIDKNNNAETTGPIGTKLSRNVPWMVLYKVTVFRSSRIFNMAAKANNML
jgi:hypothetical protein